MALAADGALVTYVARSGERHPSEDQVRAVHVLSHEARHLAGEISEARPSAGGRGP